MKTEGEEKSSNARSPRYLKLFYLALLGFFSFSWLILIQVEYELVQNPNLRDNISGISESELVYGLGVILLVMMVMIVVLFINVRDVLDEIIHSFSVTLRRRQDC